MKVANKAVNSTITKRVMNNAWSAINLFSFLKAKYAINGEGMRISVKRYNEIETSLS